MQCAPPEVVCSHYDTNNYYSICLTYPLILFTSNGAFQIFVGIGKIVGSKYLWIYILKNNCFCVPYVQYCMDTTKKSQSSLQNLTPLENCYTCTFYLQASQRWQRTEERGNGGHVACAIFAFAGHGSAKSRSKETICQGKTKSRWIQLKIIY